MHSIGRLDLGGRNLSMLVVFPCNEALEVLLYAHSCLVFGKQLSGCKTPEGWLDHQGRIMKKIHMFCYERSPHILLCNQNSLLEFLCCFLLQDHSIGRLDFCCRLSHFFCHPLRLQFALSHITIWEYFRNEERITEVLSSKACPEICLNQTKFFI